MDFIWIAIAAATCSSLIFVPQLVEHERLPITKLAEIRIGTYVVASVAVLLFLIYYFNTNRTVPIPFSILSLAVTLYIIATVLYARKVTSRIRNIQLDQRTFNTSSIPQNTISFYP
jgi:uncharacterized protein with PQ loop repeat